MVGWEYGLGNLSRFMDRSIVLDSVFANQSLPLIYLIDLKI